MIQKLKYLFFVLTLTLFIGGCGIIQPEVSSETISQETKASTNEPVVLRVATGDSGDGLTPHEEIIAKFEETYPHITVELESVEGDDYYGRLLTYAAAGNPPDIIQIGDDALPQFVEEGALQPLDNFIGGEQPLDLSIYLSGLLSPGQWQDQQYLLPKDYSPIAIYYNKKIFDEHGIAYPEDGWTWAEFLEIAQALTVDTNGDGSIDTWGVQLPATWTSGFEYWVVAANGQLVSSDGKSFVGYLDSPEVVEAVQFYADLYNTHQVAPLPKDLTKFGGANSEFDDGQAAMRIFGRWPQAGLLENPNVELGVVGVPQHTAQNNVLFWGGFGVSQGSQNSEAAWLFLRFYIGEEGSQVWKDWALPAVASVATEAGLTEDPIEGVWLDQLDQLQNRAYTYTPFWGQTGDPALQRVLEEVIIDPEADVTALLQQAAKDAQSALNEATR